MRTSLPLVMNKKHSTAGRRKKQKEKKKKILKAICHKEYHVQHDS